MPIVNECLEPGCSILCLGSFCLRHEPKQTVVYPRGRPWPPPEATVLTIYSSDRVENPRVQSSSVSPSIESRHW